MKKKGQEGRWKRVQRIYFLYPSWALARMVSKRTWTLAAERGCFTATGMLACEVFTTAFLL